MGWLTAHWAILGKTPESLDDYGVIACSSGAITSAEFGMWLKAFTSGTMEPKALPRVATSHFTIGPDKEPWLGLSLQTEPESQDGFQRPYAMTYYACVRWADVASESTRLSYRALYEALAKEDFSGGDAPFLLSPSAYDERQLAGAVNGTARRAAALLLTGRPVCVVRAGHLPLEKRLDFLDAVAALLPYGFRPTLAASTWTNSASRHRIRLSFAEVPPTHGAWELPWEDDDPPEAYPPQALLYEKELARYRGADLQELMRWLTTLAEPRDFDDASHRAAASELLQAGAAARLSVEQLLHQCRESIANGEERQLGVLTTQLARKRVPDKDRKTYRMLIRTNPIRPPQKLADSVVVRTFFETLLRLLYASPMHAADVEEVLVDLGGRRRALPPALVAALSGLLPRSSPSGRLLIASLLGSERLRTILDGMSEDELFHVAVQSRNRKVLDIVIAEADRRALPTDPRAMEAVKYALMRHRYLIEAIGSGFAAEESVLYYQNVLRVSHRRRLTSADIEEILADLDRPPQTFLLAIVAQSAPGTASTLLYALAGGAIREFGLTGTSVAGSVKAGLDRMTAPEEKWRPGKVLIGASIIVAIAAAIALWLWL
ncbi:hypothetical protein SAMN05444920_13233 [Nonomuraea solani]|uniref:Uncharacterized protein n=1 Tax=Nonomuraea solani TaxID=1144553 RepID=A0A1H6F252_9ACTN|nr:hypothetical protein [Nonomuraea solani]SEH03024.1 hypothetical protein SAMN05444920_13233 [Nonomuraea solani]